MSDLELCANCQKAPIEVIGEWYSHLCPHCADIEYEKAQERREFEYYHPNE